MLANTAILQQLSPQVMGASQTIPDGLTTKAQCYAAFTMNSSFRWTPPVCDGPDGVGHVSAASSTLLFFSNEKVLVLSPPLLRQHSAIAEVTSLRCALYHMEYEVG